MPMTDSPQSCIAASWARSYATIDPGLPGNRTSHIASALHRRGKQERSHVAKTKGGNASGRRLQVDYMTRTERVQAAVNGAEVDRVPVCFWHHFQPKGSGRAMAEATLRFFDDEFALDIAKVMPDLPYPFPRKSISSIGDWRLIEPIDIVRSPYMRERAQSIAILRDALGFDTPVIMTVFSPLAEAIYAARDREQFL